MHSESANLLRRQHFNRKWYGIRIRIFGLIHIQISMGSVPKMLWMHYLIGMSYFAKCDTNRPLIVWEMLTNIQKFHIPQCWRKWKSDPESTRGSGSPTKVNYFWRVTPFLCLPSLVDVRFRVRPLSCLQNDRHTDRQNDHITSASSAEVTILVAVVIVVVVITKPWS